MRVPYHLFNLTCAIHGATTTLDGSGYPTVTYAAKSGLSAVPCRLQDSSASDSIRWMRETGQRTSEVRLPRTLVNGTNVVVAKEDRIVIGSTTYRVLGPAIDRGGQGVNQTVLVTEDT